MSTKTSNRVISLVLAFSIFSNVALANQPVAPRGNIVDSMRDVATKFSDGGKKVCEKILLGYEKMPRRARLVTGYVVPVIPLLQLAVAKPNERFFVLIESPLIGLVTTPAAVEAASLVTGHGAVFDAQFFKDSKEQFFSFQGANLIRNRVSIDNSLTKNERSWLNWWYSTVVYSIGTAGGLIANAHTPIQQTHAWSLVAYSALWPIFSQRVSQYVTTPLLFSKFPKKQLLDDIHNVGVTKAELIAKQEAAIEAAKKKLAEIGEPTKDNKVEIGKAAEELQAAEYGLKWSKWYRDGFEDGTPVSKSRDIKYWSIKTSASMAVAVVMVTLYLLARKALVGKQGNNTPIHQAVEKARTIPQLLKNFLAQNDAADGFTDEDYAVAASHVEEHMKQLENQPVPIPTFAD